MLLPYTAGRLVHDADGAAIPDILHPSDRVLLHWRGGLRKGNNVLITCDDHPRPGYASSRQ